MGKFGMYLQLPYVNVAISSKFETNLTHVDFNSNHVDIKGRTDRTIISFCTNIISNSTSRSQTFIPIRTFINIMLLSLEELIQYSQRIFFIKKIKINFLNFSPKNRCIINCNINFYLQFHRVFSSNLLKNFHLNSNFTSSNKYLILVKPFILFSN